MTSEVVGLKCSELIEDFSIYPRNSVFDGHVADLAESIRAGAVLPPIRADKKTNRIADGIHRRRATVKVFGENAEIATQLVSYKNDAEIIRDAIRLNAMHGRRLTTADLARCALLATKHKIKRDELAQLLNVQRSTLSELVQRRTATSSDGSESVILRRPMEHLAGLKLTKEQNKVVSRVGGFPAIQLARQLCDLIESDSIQKDDEKLFKMLARLQAALHDLLVT